MKTHHLLRAASIVMFLFFAGHTAGGMQSWSPAGDTPVLQMMRSVRYNAGGVVRTYFDFYAGFGWTLSIFLLLQAVLLWQLASIAKSEPRRTRPLIGSFLIATIAAAIVQSQLVVPVPVVFGVVLAAILGAAFVTAGRQHEPIA